jgi:hypothetical protein
MIIYLNLYSMLLLLIRWNYFITKSNRKLNEMSVSVIMPSSVPLDDTILANIFYYPFIFLKILIGR